MFNLISDNILLFEISILIGIVCCFFFVLIYNVYLRKKLHKKKIYGMSRFWNALFIGITNKLIEKIDDKNLKEANKELQTVLSENFMRENINDKVEETTKESS